MGLSIGGGLSHGGGLSTGGGLAEGGGLSPIFNGYWTVSGVSGNVTTLGQLATILNANPSANVTQVGNYNASRDGTFTSSVVTTPYTGTFNGAGFSISNLTIIDADTSGATALFKNAAAGSTITNLIIHGSVSGSGQLGSAAFACTLGGTIQNCTNYATITNSNTGARVGGLVSFCNATGIITGCTNYGSVLAPAVSSYQGGICGLTWGSVLTCVNYANLSNSTSTGAWLGGICGAVGNTSGTFATTIVTNCTNHGTITGNIAVNNAGNYCGGVMGNFLDGTVTGCINTAAVSGGNNVGGICGRQEVFTASGATPTMVNCYNTGNITAAFLNCGGISGTCEYTISGAYNTGVVIGAQNVGGIAGSSLGTEFSATIDHAFNFGSVTSASHPYAGGIIGSLATSTSMDQCYSLGVIVASSNAGGVVGNFRGTATNCYWDTTTSGLTRGAGNVTTPTGITGKTDTQMLAAILTGFDAAWTRQAGGPAAGGYNYLTAMAAPAAPTFATPVTILLTGSGNWTVPADWNNSNNSIIAIGEGGNGGNATTLLPGRGGGAGARVKNTNQTLTPGASIPYVCGTGSSSTKTTFNTSTLIADFGVAGTTGANGTGGSIANSTGTSKFAGGAGASSTGAGAAGGGGAAASDAGAGKNGGGAVGNTTHAGGGGGGGTGGGTVGVAGTTSGGGNGGTPLDGTAGGAGSTDTSVAGGAGTLGSGGGGGFASTTQASNGGAGGDGFEFDLAGYGGGGGGGGGLSATLTTGANGGAGGLYGGGGGGGGRGTTTPGTGGAGAPGCIIIRYTP